MTTFIGLLDTNQRAQSIKNLIKLYHAEDLVIFVKDLEANAFLPAPGFDQTIQNGRVWHGLLNSHASEPVHSGTISFDDHTAKHITLISYESKISFAILAGEATKPQIEEIQDALPFLLVIFQKERKEQYSEVQLSEAEQSVMENKSIALKLENTRRELQKALIKTRDEIEAIKKAQELKDSVDSLTKQRNDLIRVNKVKDQFISVASHQLRTPATATKQYMGLLLESYAGELTPEQLQYLQIAYDSNEAQLSILNDLLKTAQLDSADIILRKKLTVLKPVIENIIMQLKPTFDIKKQIVNFQHAENSIVASVNEEDIKLAITNLLENASKYTDVGKKIIITLSAESSYTNISVKDEGVGIGEKDLESIFEKFTRIDNALSDTVTGSGLGLYLVKRIVQLHDGSISVVSTVGKGSVFTVRLPL